MATNTGTIFDSLSNYTTPASGAAADQGLAGQAAKQNISAGGDISSLATLLQNINNLNNTNRVYGGAGLEQQSSQNISNELAGVLDNPIVANDQMLGAQRGAAGGFGVDSANTNAAVLRAMNLQKQDLQQRGQQDLTSAYNRAAPLVDASQFAMTPALLQQQQDAAAQRELQSQSLANAQAEWQAQLAAQQGQFSQSQAQQLAEYTQGQQQQQGQYASSLAQQQADLSARMGLSYAQLQQAGGQFGQSQAQQQQQWAGSLAAQTAQANQANALEQARLQSQESEFGTTSAENAAQLYAQTYHALPGYNQYGQYTGQTGTMPAPEAPAAPTAPTTPANTAFRDLPIEQQLAELAKVNAGNNFRQYSAAF